MISNTIDNLAKKYNLLGTPIDLSIFYKKDGENTIFDLLSSLYRPVFEDNQRIVVIQPDDDWYSYSSNQASDSLIFLQQSLQKIDISNFFVVVITGNQAIETELKWLQETYSTDTNPIKYVLIDSEFKKNIKSTDTFCVNMWNHLYASTQLEILPCCVAANDKPLGKLTTATVDEIINGDNAKNIRLKMLSSQRCNECVTCYNQEDAGFTSRRLRNNDRFKDIIPHLKSQTNPDGSLTNFSPQTLDIRLNNICNLKCRTCSGVSSSKLAVEEKKLFNNKVNFEKTPNSNTRDLVLESLINYFGSAEYIHFAGGEPLIMGEHYKILNHLLKINKITVPISYTTNFTNLKYKNNNILDYWKKFSNLTINASLDGHGKVFEYVRHGAKWKDIETNLLKLQKECPHAKFNVTSTVSLISVESIIELQRMWHDRGLLSINNFKINLMASGNYLSLQSLLQSHKNYISKKIDDHCQWLIEVNALELEDEWKKIKTFMLSNDTSYTNNDFAKVNFARDLERKERFELVYPQFSDLFKPHINLPNNETKIH